jgi:hypothetical protein
MPFCPKCRDEFQDWVKVCPDCGVALVDKLPEPPAPPEKEKFDDRIMRIATAPNEPIAYMWAGILENNGIYCLLKSSNLKSAMYSLLTNQQYSIYVFRTTALRAKRVLSPFEKSQQEYVGSRENLYPISSRVFIIIIHLVWLIVR